MNDSNKKIDKIRELTDEYKTFYLSYYVDNNHVHPYNYSSHILRPSTSTYEYITDVNTIRSITLEPALYTFSHDMTIPEILIECTLRGITVDFIELMKYEKDKVSHWDEAKIFKTIDTHKDDMSEFIEKIDFPRFYIAKCKNKLAVLKYLVIDKFKQSFDVNILLGEYENSGIIAGFKDQQSASEYLKFWSK